MSRLEVELRHALASDLDAILALERATPHAPHWPPSAYSAIVDIDTAGADRSRCTGPYSAPQRCLIVAQTAAQTMAQTAIQAAAERDGAVAGFAVGLIQPAPASVDSVDHLHVPPCAGRVGELESIVVAASARRAGIGSALCGVVLDWCRRQGATEVMLEVRSASAAAIALYAGLGFAQAGRRPGYYRDPEDDALILRVQWD